MKHLLSAIGLLCSSNLLMAAEAPVDPPLVPSDVVVEVRPHAPAGGQTGGPIVSHTEDKSGGIWWGEVRYSLEVAGIDHPLVRAYIKSVTYQACTDQSSDGTPKAGWTSTLEQGWVEFEPELVIEPPSRNWCRVAVSFEDGAELFDPARQPDPVARIDFDTLVFDLDSDDPVVFSKSGVTVIAVFEWGFDQAPRESGGADD